MSMNLRKTLVAGTAAVAGVLLYFVLAAFGEMGDYPHKIWLHRCNSIEKLHQMRQMYPNIEVDVVYREDGRLDVTHDLDTTFNLELEEYFSHYASNVGKMWLDIKNVSADNRDSILQRLDFLTREYGVDRSRLIVESSMWELLAPFTEAGFYTSWYLPFDKPQRLDDARMEECMAAIEKVAWSGCVKAVSFPYWWYGAVRKLENLPVDMLTWKHRSSQFLFLLSGEGKRMLKDAGLKVVLVKDKGDFHR